MMVFSMMAAFAAAWIGDGLPDRNGADWYDEDPAPEFRAEFVLRPGVTNVTVRFACAGYAQVFFSPGGCWLSGLETPWSVYDKTVYSLATTRAAAPYPAVNTVTVRLGNGFYNLPPMKFWGHYEFRSVLAHGRPCFNLEIDGAEQPLEWKWRRTNVLRNSVYLGAEVDATRPEDADWKPAAEVRGPRGKIVPWPGRHGPRVNCNVAHGRAKWLREGVQVVDFGTNATGVPAFRFRGEERGTRIEIVYGERLNADGSVNVLTQTAGQIKRAGRGGPGAPDVACQRDVYVCRGNEADRSRLVRSDARYETFEPPFAWHVFRYAEVRGAKNLLEENAGACRCDISGVAVPLPAAKAFRPRHPAFGDIHDMCTRTFQANLVGAVQSDCPGRERLGYGGDIVGTCEAYMLNWDMREIYLKILRDFADEAEDDGWLTETAPYVGIAVDGFGGRSGPISWTVAVPVLMDALMRHYPDVKDRALAFYPVCARYARLVDAKCPDGVVPRCIGDHEALERAPDEVTATAHWHLFAALTAKFARLLGRDAEAAEFEGIAAKTKAAFAAKFVKDGVVANGSESAQAIALYLGLVPEEQVAAAEKRLLAAIDAAGGAFTTGIFSTRYLLMYLSEHGRRDVAERLVLHRGFPGYLHMIDRGATTLWETWKESDDVYSNCHPMFGSVDEWILRFGDENGRTRGATADVAHWDFSDAKGWRTSSPVGGCVLEAGGPDGSAALGVIDAGTNNCKWLSPAVRLKPRHAYGFAAKAKVSAQGGGITYGTPAQNVTESAGARTEWRELRTVVVAADRPDAYGETFRLGEYHLNGSAAFDDARVVELRPEYARGADGLELGHGERVSGTRYFFNTYWGSDGRNHARPLESLRGVSYNSGNVDVYAGTSITFRHALPGRVWKSASVTLSTPRSISGEGLEARADDGAWTPLAAVTNAARTTATLPASLFPARELRVRFAPRKGGGGRLTGYSFQGTFEGPEAHLAGRTRYLEAETGAEFARIDAPVFYTQGYGAVLSAPNAPFTAWTALSGWKIPKDHPAPEAKTDAVRVSAAANEAEAVQLVLRANEDIARVRVTCGPLQTRDAVQLPGSAVEIFREGYVNVATAKDRVGCADDWPDPLFDQALAPTVYNPEGVRKGENAPFWVRVTVPKGTPKGVYAGTLAAETEKGRHEFPFEVEVYGFELPDKLACRTAFGMGTGHLDSYHRVKTRADRERVHDMYFRSLAAHRISPYDPAPGARWKVTWKDGEPVFDWSGWDGPIEAAFAKYGFDGLRIGGLGLGGGNAQNRWPGQVPGTNVTETSAAYEPLMAKFLGGFENHLREKGWLDKAYLYCYDEPRACDDVYVRRGLGLVAKYAPAIDRLLTAPVREGLIGGPNVWCPIASDLGYPREAERRAAGDRMWLYVCMFPKPPYPSLFIDHPGVDLRVWLWQSWREGVEGVLVWNTTWWTSPLPYPDKAHPQDPYRDTIAWSPSIPGQGASNGDGRFFYPPPRSCAAFEAGEDCGPIFEKPVETIRLEYVRDGLEDYEYFATLKRLDPTNPLLVVPPEVSASRVEFSIDPAHMAAHRAKLAREIERLQADAFTVDAAIPAGNAVVLERKDDVVRLRPDQRGTVNETWFYWAFRVKGVAGRTIRFEFPERKPGGGPVGVRGPVVSKDRGATFTYPLDGKANAWQFTYAFGPDENETWFYECHPYVRADWDAFVKRHAAELGRSFAVETLCTSRKGADVPRARFGCIARPPKHRVFVSARHHCSESMASWVLEGLGEAFLAQDDLGAWLRENVELMMVPMTDYDGVQAGDQGKRRAPHDHNRDYSEFIYPETKAIADWIGSHAGGKLDMFIDVHCPWIRGDYNEFLYTPWKDPKFLPSPDDERRYSRLLEKLQCGSMRYRADDDLPFGKRWNTGGNYNAGWSAVIWACHRVEGLKIARSYEVPFANANGAVVTPATCRDLGRDTARVWRAFFAEKELPYCVDGIYPHLATFNDEGECGTGAVVPWAGRLWAVTYGPHSPVGSSDRLYEITPDLKRIVRPESVGGTPANRMIHRESNQLFIGPYAIDAERNVRVIPPRKMPGRLTATARHPLDPANRVYVATMDNGLYEVDARTLAVKTLVKDDNGIDGRIWGAKAMKGFPYPPDWNEAITATLPGSHTKGMATGFGLAFLANNGEYDPRSVRDPWIPSGVLGAYDPATKTQRTIRRCQFTEVTTRDGILGNEHPNANPVWSLGWDVKSVIVAVSDDGREWKYFRLPKASHAYDGAHGWNTEWPRIREAGLGGGNLLATMHGTFWRFPKDFSAANPRGIRPISTYLKVIGDFCWWSDAPGGGAIVFGCDDQAKSAFLGNRALKKDAPRLERSQSNLWFVKPEDLAKFGPPSGEGWVWLGEDVKAGDVSDPFLYAGYEEMGFECTDAHARPCRTELVREGDWVRVRALEDITGANAHFVYGPKPTPEVKDWVSTVGARCSTISVTDDSGKVWKFPNVNGDATVVCREVVTERDLLYAGGVFYEVPAENAGGFAVLRPIALADEPVKSIEARLGLVFVNGKPMAVDSLWRNGTAAKAHWLWRNFTKR